MILEHLKHAFALILALLLEFRKMVSICLSKPKRQGIEHIDFMSNMLIHASVRVQAIWLWRRESCHSAQNHNVRFF